MQHRGDPDLLAYLSRYTHRVAISNRRLISADARTVSFDYKGYADGARPKTMTRDRAEFVRRFGLHILPERFVKIRHYGLLGNRQRQERLAGARALLSAALPPAPAPAEPAAAKETRAEPPRAVCPFCQQPALVLLREVEPERAARLVTVLDSS